MRLVGSQVMRLKGIGYDLVQQNTILLMDDLLLILRVLDAARLRVVLVLLVRESNVDLVVHRLHLHNELVLLFGGGGLTLDRWCAWVELALSIWPRSLLFGIHLLGYEAVLDHLIDVLLFLGAILEVRVLYLVGLLWLLVVASRVHAIKLHLLLLRQRPLLIGTL